MNNEEGINIIALLFDNKGFELNGRNINQYEAINQAILEKLDRGTTLFFAKGGYTQQDKVVIKVVIPKKQYHDLMQIVINADKNAFMSLQTTSDIFGFGFKRYE